MARIAYLTAIDFGPGELAALAGALEDLGIARPLIVSDHGVAAAGLLDRTKAMAAGPVFLDMPPNPTEEAVAAALALYRAEACDGVVAIGGGSPIDLAKGVALLATHEGPLEPYAAIYGGMRAITAAVAPVIAIPTTAGTGAEVGRAALLTLDDGRKLGFISPHLIPKRAICDPELTLGLPPGLTAATGLDALSHCIETFLSPRVQPAGRGDRARRRGAHLAQPAGARSRDGGDLEARTEMMMGALRGRPDLPEGPRRRALAVPRARRPQGRSSCTTAR